ncbi:helix-turn-helix domain-containing protein [Virgibacillus sp. DJP39]|uniref:helix-turn-helix domain-containing protein n=1 Tax=Virgibacillus sp. DJP39 TaxID=3409790 RepID=UPI003BB4D1DF
MQQISFEVEDETYEKIKKLIDWINLDNEFSSVTVKKEKVKIEDFVKGSVIEKMDDIDTMQSLLNPPEVYSGMEVRNHFKKVAKEKEIQQVDICERIGINKTNLSLIFNNKKTLRTDVFFKIWLILGSPPLNKILYLSPKD